MKINKAKGYPDMLALFFVLAVVLTGCGQNSDTRTPAESTANSITTENVEPAEKETKATDLEVCFGDDGEPFILHLYENDTAAAIARHVGTADWRLRKGDTMQAYSSETEIIRNLQDAGCGMDTISEFMRELKAGNMEAGLKLLAVHRRFLLDELHKEQKQIDCLDYLVYQVEKQNRQMKRA